MEGISDIRMIPILSSDCQREKAFWSVCGEEKREDFAYQENPASRLA
jgi:hypothetical protein